MNLFRLPTGIPYLSLIWLSILAGAIICSLLPRNAKNAIRWTATIVSFISLGIALLLYMAYDPNGKTFQFVEQLTWVPQIWISYFVGADGINLPLYLMGGSVFIIIGMLAVYFAGGRTFNLLDLAQNNQFSPAFQFAFFMPMFAGFAVLAGMFPFHTWSPTGHVAAPTAVSMLHAGVLMKLGSYGALRVARWLMPAGAQMWAPVIITLSLVNAVYGATIAMAQRDFKFVIGYSSVSHMGLVVMGLATLNRTGLNGAVLQMFAHGIMTGLFFAVVGRMVYERTHTRQLPELGGLAQIMPFAAGMLIIGGFSSMGMPGFARLFH